MTFLTTCLGWRTRIRLCFGFFVAKTHHALFFERECFHERGWFCQPCQHSGRREFFATKNWPRSTPISSSEGWDKPQKMSTGFNWKFTLYLLVVSIHFKNISQIMSNWKSSPSRSENKKSVKPPPTVAIYLCEIKCAHSQFCDFQLGFKNTLFSGPKNPVWTEMRAKLGNPHEVKVCFCTACKKSCQGKRLISLLHV